MGQAARDALNGNACEVCGAFLWNGDEVILGSPENRQAVEYNERKHRDIGFPIYHKDCVKERRNDENN